MSDTNRLRLTMPSPQMRAVYVMAIVFGFLGTLFVMQFHEPPEAARGAPEHHVGQPGHAARGGGRVVL